MKSEIIESLHLYMTKEEQELAEEITHIIQTAEGSKLSRSNLIRRALFAFHKQLTSFRNEGIVRNAAKQK